jgi:hypothetical protein
MKKAVVISMIFITLLSSCDKISDKEPCILKDIEVTTNSPVIEGWPIYLSTRPSQTESFNWQGPNGKITTSGAQNSIQVLNAAFSDSGIYKVELTNTFGCLEYTRSTIIRVIPAPFAPCTVTNNTSTSTVIGVGDESYTYVSFTNNIAIGYPNIASSYNTLIFNFFGNAIPKQGVYKTTGGMYSLNKETEVGCFINAFPTTYFINKEGQNIYVNKVNGKLQISFCNADFTNPIGTSAIKISAKITEP